MVRVGVRLLGYTLRVRVITSVKGWLIPNCQFYKSSR